MVAMYALATGLGVPRFAAAALALVFAISPAALVYENLLFYPYPVAAMLCVTFLALLRYLRTSSAMWAPVLFGVSALLVYTRATYHVLWFIALFVVVVVSAVVAATTHLPSLALLPLVVTIGLYTKNAVLFDTFH